MTSKRKFVKKAVSIGLSATLALSAVGFSALAETSDENVFPSPTETPVQVDTSVLTATSQRAASEIPLVFGVNVVAGTLFSGPIDMAGTDVNEATDPYLYNYNYLLATGDAPSDSDPEYYYYNDGSVVSALGSLYNGNGLYSSGGGNQVYFGGAGNVDAFFGFNSTVYAEIVSQGEDAVITDVQTGSATSRLYAWAEMGNSLSGYLTENKDKSVRYDDPYTIAVNLEQFSAGIPYYIAYLIDTGSLTKKTAAFVTAYDEDNEIFTCEDPAEQGDVRSDMFAEVNNFNFVDDNDYTAEELEDAGVSLVILSATGYSYTGGTTGQSDSLSNKKADVIDVLVSEYGSSGMPIVMSGTNYNVIIGNNGYNYSPITCMFMPYIQAYAYMDQLSSVNGYINPAAMVQYMVETFFHVKSDNSAAVAAYYIGDNWNSTGTNDNTPSTSGTYDTDKIESAIKLGIQYALYLNQSDTDSTHTLLAAERLSETAYKVLTDSTLYATETPSESTEKYYVSIDVNGTTEYISIDDIVSSCGSEIASYYGYTNASGEYGGTYNYGWDLQETLQYYADHINAHIWDPVTSQSGTYGYKLSALTIS